MDVCILMLKILQFAKYVSLDSQKLHRINAFNASLIVNFLVILIMSANADKADIRWSALTTSSV